MMRFLFFGVVSLLLCSQGICKERHGRQLHALILYDSTSHSLKASHKADAQAMERAVRKIAHVTKEHLRIRFLRKNEIPLNDIHSWLSHVHSKDSVLVYYSGEETLNEKDQSRWPSLSVGNENCNAVVSAYSLWQMVLREQPRMTLAFFDFYNSAVELPKPYGDRLCSPFDKKFQKKTISNYWPKTSGNLLACSHAKGAQGYGLKQSERRRGRFTYAVLRALSSRAPTWYPYFLKHNLVTHIRLPRQQAEIQSTLKCSVPVAGIKD